MGFTHAVDQPNSPAQRQQTLRLFVHAPGVVPEQVVPTRPSRVLQSEDGLWVEEVNLAVTTPLVFAADIECAVLRAVQ